MEGSNEGLVTFAVYIGSILNGVGGSIFWVAQGKYLSQCVLICEEKSGLYTSIFWTITLGSQIFAYLFNSIILGMFEASTLFIICTLMSFIGIAIYGILPDPELPPNYVETKESAAETLRVVIRLFTDKRVT
jgi:hypothetical protein